jgi:hypothetical protein
MLDRYFKDAAGMYAADEWRSGAREQIGVLLVCVLAASLPFPSLVNAKTTHRTHHLFSSHRITALTNY